MAVVDGASLEVKRGELTILVGPSGAGKTTLARLVAGVEELDAGEIFFDGRLIHKLPPPDRKVGLVFQDDSLWPAMTIAENVGHALRWKGVDRAERKSRVEALLSLVRLDALAERRPDQLSPSQRLRAELARAMVLEPEFLIIDDPFSRVSPRDRPEIREDFRSLAHSSETTILILTSDPTECSVSPTAWW